jgi:hypothetical protein
MHFAPAASFFVSVRVSESLLLAVNNCKATRFSEDWGQRRDRQQDRAGNEDSHSNSSHMKKESPGDIICLRLKPELHHAALSIPNRSSVELAAG